MRQNKIKMSRVKEWNLNVFFVNIRYGLMQRVFSVETDVSKKLYETCGRKFVIWFADVSLPLKSKHVWELKDVIADYSNVRCYVINIMWRTVRSYSFLSVWVLRDPLNAIQNRLYFEVIVVFLGSDTALFGTYLPGVVTLDHARRKY